MAEGLVAWVDLSRKPFEVNDRESNRRKQMKNRMVGIRRPLAWSMGDKFNRP